MFTQLLSQPPIPLNKARSNLEFGARVESVIMKALSRQPGDRYPDILVFARELHNALLAAAPPQEPEDAGIFSKMRGLFRR